jgi:hypothetical protein
MTDKPDKPDKLNAGFKRFQRERPGASFAQYYAFRMRKRLDDGIAHTTLGGKLFEPANGKMEFAQAGAERFRRFRRMMELKTRHRLVDYGCGSLRIGYHAMNYLNPGNYFGLDVTTDFIDVGKTLIGDALTARRPYLAAISPQSLAEAKKFAADFVFSNSVALHVHPDETAIYYGNLQSLAWKPGAGLFFNVRLSDTPVHFAASAWSWPLEFYIAALPELAFIGKRQNGMIEFRRR